MKTFGRSHNGEAFGSGSISDTSRATPFKCPSFKTCNKASFLIRLPRPTLISNASFFIRRRRFSSKRPMVSDVFGRHPTTMSAVLSLRSNWSDPMTSSKPGSALWFGWRRKPMMDVSKAFKRWAREEPMSPVPRIRTVFL